MSKPVLIAAAVVVAATAVLAPRLIRPSAEATEPMYNDRERAGAADTSSADSLKPDSGGMRAPAGPEPNLEARAPDSSSDGDAGQAEQASPTLQQGYLPGGPDDWEAKYANHSWRQLQEEAKTLKEFIKSGASEELKRRLEEGEYEVVSSTGTVHNIDSGPNRVIEGLDLLLFKHGGDVQRYQVPRDQFPDLYAAADEVQWIEQRVLFMQTLEKKQGSR